MRRLLPVLILLLARGKLGREDWVLIKYETRIGKRTEGNAFLDDEEKKLSRKKSKPKRTGKAVANKRPNRRKKN